MYSNMNESAFVGWTKAAYGASGADPQRLAALYRGHNASASGGEWWWAAEQLVADFARHAHDDEELLLDEEQAPTELEQRWAKAGGKLVSTTSSLRFDLSTARDPARFVASSSLHCLRSSTPLC